MKRLLLLISISLLSLITEAQTNLTFYNFNSVAQSNLLNPALPSRQGFTLGLLDFYGHAYVPGVTMYDIFRKDETQETTIDKLLSNSKYHLRDMQINSQINPLFFGLRRIPSILSPLITTSSQFVTWWVLTGLFFSSLSLTTLFVLCTTRT